MRDPRTAVRRFLKRRFYAVGVWVGTRPWTTISLVLFLSFAFTPALITARWESRIEYLYVPTEAESFHGADGSVRCRPTVTSSLTPATGATPAAHARHHYSRPPPPSSHSEIWKTFSRRSAPNRGWPMVRSD